MLETAVRATRVAVGSQGEFKTAAVVCPLEVDSSAEVVVTAAPRTVLSLRGGVPPVQMWTMAACTAALVWLQKIALGDRRDLGKYEGLAAGRCLTAARRT